GPDGKKLSKRVGGSTIASLRDAGYPPEAVHRYLESLGLPEHDVHLDLDRLRAFSVDVLSALSDLELALRIGVPERAVLLARGARDLVEARRLVDEVLGAPGVESTESTETLARFGELRAPLGDVLSKDEAKALLRELKAVGGNLRGLRIALTGAER